MVPTRILLVMRAIGLLTALVIAGCAATAPVVAHPAEDVEITVRPWQKPIRFVTLPLPKEGYLFVGKVRATAPDGDFVEAARVVERQLRDKARALGADVIRLDIVSPESRNHVVLLAGRAYRAVAPD